MIDESILSYWKFRCLSRWCGVIVSLPLGPWMVQLRLRPTRRPLGDTGCPTATAWTRWSSVPHWRWNQGPHHFSISKKNLHSSCTFSKTVMVIFQFNFQLHRQEKYFGNNTGSCWLYAIKLKFWCEASCDQNLIPNKISAHSDQFLKWVMANFHRNWWIWGERVRFGNIPGATAPNFGL